MMHDITQHGNSVVAGMKPIFQTSTTALTVVSSCMSMHQGWFEGGPWISASPL